MKLLTYLISVLFLLGGCNATKKSKPYTETRIHYNENTLEITFYFKDCSEYLNFLSKNIETNNENKEIEVGKFLVKNEYNAYHDPRVKNIIIQECIENMHLNDYINIFGVPYLLGSKKDYLEHEGGPTFIGISATIQDSILTNVKVDGGYVSSSH